VARRRPIRLLLFNDTDQDWHCHAAGLGPAVVVRHSGELITVGAPGDIILKVWPTMYLLGPLLNHQQLDIFEGDEDQGGKP